MAEQFFVIFDNGYQDNSDDMCKLNIYQPQWCLVSVLSFKNNARAMVDIFLIFSTACLSPGLAVCLR